MHVLHLDGHGLVVVDQRVLLLRVDPDLFDEVLGRRPLVRLLLADRQSLICFD